MPKKSVLELINEVAADPEHREEVSVLPLMCGTGKSTAISYKIKQTIEEAPITGNGLLIITDRKDRMEEYMYLHINEEKLQKEPRLDRSLVEFLWKNQYQVTIMTQNNLDEAFKTYKFRPVLMMTTQRFFRLAQEEIEQFLRWIKDDKPALRPLIIIDERPELTTIVELNEKKINDCRIAIEHAFQKEEPYIPLYEINQAGKAVNDFVANLNNYGVGGKEDIYCFWSWYTDEEHRECKYMRERFSRISRKRSVINNYSGGTYYEDYYTRIRGIYHLTQAKALFYRHWLPTQVCLNDYYTFLDNTSLLMNLPAKTLILDGTAKFSPEYKLLTNDIRDYPEYDRNLKHLKIHVIDLPTGKTRMRNKKYQNYVLNYVRTYYDEKIRPEIGTDYNKLALFTYKDIESNYCKWIPKEHVEHFGNIVGKNDFGKAKHIIQVGLNRFPDSIYYLYYLALHPEEEKRYENMQDKGYDVIQCPENQPDEYLEEHGITREQWQKDNTDTVTFYEVKMINAERIQNQSSEIKKQIQDQEGEVCDIMNNILLAEIEQNLFRGIIRQDSCAEDFHFHLFTNTKSNRALIQMMRDRFEPLGAKVYEDDSNQMIISKIMMRSGDGHIKQFICWHDKELKKDAEYTPADIRKACNISETDKGIKIYEQMVSKKKNPLVHFLLDNERVRRGVYKKKRNWFHQ